MLGIKSKFSHLLGKVKLSFRAKIILIGILPLTVVSVVAVKTVQTSNDLVVELRYIIENTVGAITNSKDMVNDINYLNTSFYLMTQEDISDDYFDTLFVNSEDAIQRLDVSSRIYSKLDMPDKAKELKRKVFSEWDSTIKNMKVMLEHFDNEDNESAKTLFTTKLKKQLAGLRSTLSNIQLNNTDVIEYQKNKFKTLKVIKNSTSALIAFSIIIAVLGFLLFFVKKLVREMTKTVSVVDEAVESSIKACQEMGNIASEVEAVFNDIRNSMQNTSSSSHEIKLMSENNTNSIEKSQEILKSNLVGITGSIKVSKEMERMFSSIRNSSEELGSVLSENQSNMSKIIALMDGVNQKVSLINDVVFQTKLLSFNASVEAARAGEAGRGFSVVAEEVSSLALQSGTSASEIFELLENTKKQVEEIVKSSTYKFGQAIDKTNEYINSSTELVSKINTEFKELESNITDSENIGNSISQASNDQLVGLKKLEESFFQINELSTNSTKKIQELIDSSKQIKEEASRSGVAVSKFLKLVS